MGRSKPKKSGSVSKFKGRAAKTHPLNHAQPLRGGIRL